MKSFRFLLKYKNSRKKKGSGAGLPSILIPDYKCYLLLMYVWKLALSNKASIKTKHFAFLLGKSKVAIRVTDDGRIFIKRSSEDRNLDPDRLMIDRYLLII